MPAVVARAIELALEVAGEDKAAGERLFRRLQEPFAVSMLTDVRQHNLLELANAIDWSRLCVDALASSEPDVEWQGELLLRRVRCYEVRADARLRAARRDLNQYLANEPMPFAAGF